MKVRKYNLDTVSDRLNKALKNKSFTHQLIYRKSEVVNNMYARLGVPLDECIRKVEKSIDVLYYSHFIDVEKDFIPGCSFIRIRNINFSGAGYTAFLVKSGDDIKFSKNQIRHTCGHRTNSSKCINIINIRNK
ncbi:MAG: hypothetical protein GY928_14725 [Colwellia sp.]|nr:hypothetical protein [Colwellia sp.]